MRTDKYCRLGGSAVHAAHCLITARGMEGGIIDQA